MPAQTVIVTKNPAIARGFLFVCVVRLIQKYNGVTIRYIPHLSRYHAGY